jgi:ABC-type sugar transport system ATPase subunit
MPVLELHGIHKHYGRTRALDGLDLTIRSGELLGIAGPNGAGKSTLIRLLAGEEAPDAGEMALDRDEWVPASHRVGVVHQEPSLFPNLTVAENLLVARAGARLRRPKLSDRELHVLAQLGIAEYAHAPLGSCSLVVRQLTAIARALVYNAEIFLFDEPNSALTEDESARLFQHMHALEEAGRFVILVSHRLAELEAHARRVAVILDGRCSAVLEREGLSQEAIGRELVVGEAAHAVGPRAVGERGSSPSERLRLRGWSHRAGAFSDVDLEVDPGEIVALVGVEGSGARELLASTAGLEAADGSISVGEERGIGAVRQLVAFLPADRRASLFPNFSLAHNLVARLGAPAIASVLGYLRKGRILHLAASMRARFRVRAESLDQPVTALSGGNQQKVAIAAAIAQKPLLLVLEEPTRGVDIGSKAEIYRVLRDFADEGGAVLAFCTEVPEVFELADRVAILDRGRIARILDVRAYADVVALAAQMTAFKHHVVEEERSE